MTDSIALTGVVATTPRNLTTTEGLEITSFRLASSQRRFDKLSQAWVDIATNWYTVTAFRHLASHLAVSVHKGDRVLALGRLRISDWHNGDRKGTTVEIEADAVGHDLAWGNAVFHKNFVPNNAHENAESVADYSPENTVNDEGSVFSDNSHLNFSGAQGNGST